MDLLEKINATMLVKSENGAVTTFKLSFVAGIYIAFGAFLYTLATSQTEPEDLTKLLGAVLFSIGLNFVVFFKFFNAVLLVKTAS